MLFAALTPGDVLRAEEACVLTGVVTGSDGSTVEGATVALTDPVKFFAADAQGSFCIERLSPGDYELLVRAPGYRDALVPFRIPTPDGSTLGVELEPGIRDQVVVTATRTDRSLTEVPIRVEVMNRDEIEQVEARTLADAVEYSNGVYVESNCQNCNFAQVRMLGLDGAYSQILLDSQPVISSLAAVYGIEQIPAEMIQQLEIVKGGGSALYGSGAVGGVINVIPRVPVTNRGTARMQIGSTEGNLTDERPGSFHGSFDLVTPDRRTGVTAFVQSSRVAPLDLSGDGFTDVALRDLLAAGVRLNHEVGEGGKGRVVFDVSRIDEERRGGNNLDLPPDQADIAEAIDSTRTGAIVSWRHEATRNLDYALTASYALTERDTYYGSGQDPNAFGETTNPLVVLDAQFNREAGEHLLTWGAQYSRDHLQDEQPAYDRFTDETYTNAGLYLQDDWAMGPKWSLLWGGRVDKHSEVSRPIFSPRVAAMFKPNTELKLRGSVAGGFRAPQIFDEDLHITQVGGEGQVIRNSEDLREETSLSTMLGMEWIPMVGNRFARLESNLFYTGIEDQFQTVQDDDPSTPEFEFTRVNLGSARVYGIELNGDYSLSRNVTLSAGLVFQRSEYGEPEPDFGSTRFFRTPEEYGLLGLDWDIPRVAELFLVAKYTGSMLVPHFIFDPETGEEIDSVLETSPDFLTWDLRLNRGFRMGRKSALDVTVGVRNLTNQFQEDLDQGEFRDSGYVYGPRFPRMFYVAAGYSF